MGIQVFLYSSQNLHFYMSANAFKRSNESGTR